MVYNNGNTTAYYALDIELVDSGKDSIFHWQLGILIGAGSLLGMLGISFIITRLLALRGLILQPSRMRDVEAGPHGALESGAIPTQRAPTVAMPPEPASPLHKHTSSRQPSRSRDVEAGPNGALEGAIPTERAPTVAVPPEVVATFPTFKYGEHPDGVGCTQTSSRTASEKGCAGDAEIELSEVKLSEAQNGGAALNGGLAGQGTASVSVEYAPEPAMLVEEVVRVVGAALKGGLVGQGAASVSVEYAPGPALLVEQVGISSSAEANLMYPFSLLHLPQLRPLIFSAHRLAAAAAQGQASCTLPSNTCTTTASTPLLCTQIGSSSSAGANLMHPTIPHASPGSTTTTELNAARRLRKSDLSGLSAPSNSGEEGVFPSGQSSGPPQRVKDPLRDPASLDAPIGLGPLGPLGSNYDEGGSGSDASEGGGLDRSQEREPERLLTAESQEHNEDLCSICIVEYEEGETLRKLPLLVEPSVLEAALEREQRQRSADRAQRRRARRLAREARERARQQQQSVAEEEPTIAAPSAPPRAAS
eukprot:gene19386-26036_t